MYSNKVKTTYQGLFTVKVCDILPLISEIDKGTIYYELKSNNLYTNVNGLWELVGSCDTTTTTNYYTSTDICDCYIPQKEEPIKSIELIKCPNCDAPLKIFTKGFHNCPYCNSSIHIS